METYARLTEPETPRLRNRRRPVGLHGPFSFSAIASSHHASLPMIIITKPNITDDELDHLRERIEAAGLHTHLSRGEHRTIVGCIGDEAKLLEIPLRSIPGVESVMPVLKPYKLASREFVVNRTVVRVGEEASFFYASSSPPRADTPTRRHADTSVSPPFFPPPIRRYPVSPIHSSPPPPVNIATKGD